VATSLGGDRPPDLPLLRSTRFSRRSRQTGEHVVVGVSKYVDTEPGLPIEVHRVDPETQHR
jgi:methylmalonyl-CoA mutase N-terminal domain/subunit